jgi:hypothetical protein
VPDTVIEILIRIKERLVTTVYKSFRGKIRRGGFIFPLACAGQYNAGANSKGTN